MRAAPFISGLLLVVASPAGAAEVNGYLDSRTQVLRARPQGLVPTEDIAQLDELIEGNIQAKQGYAPRGFVFGDLSLFARASGSYRTLDASGTEVGVGDHDVPAYHPLTSINELYLSHDVSPQLNLLLGKKRIIWGSGVSYNPTDILNPPKDPTDPTFQRVGAWMARIEVPLATSDRALIQNPAFTLLFSPAVLELANGIPYRFLTYPSWDRRDSQAHYLLAARAYALIANSDVNLMAFYGNRYGDAFERKLRLGASFSRYFGGVEVHGEALLQQGSARAYPRAECLTDRSTALGCVTNGTPLLDTLRIADATVLPRILVGSRYQFSDDSLLSLEYLYQADGYSRKEFQSFVNTVALQREAARLGLPMTQPPASTGETGIPLKFAFEPVTRHYLFLSFEKSKIFEDFTLQATVIASLQDLSGLIAPTVRWAAREWLTVALALFIPFPGPRSLAAAVPETVRSVSEYTLLPLQYSGVLQLRLFY